jgi:predicted nucleotidyltransferase
MVVTQDFKEFIELLNESKVQYLVVGGYAVGFHGYPRYTKDLDVWILVSQQNAENLIDALDKFGFGSVGLSVNDFLKPDEFVQLGFPPNRIDIVTSCDGITFEECYDNRVTMEIDGIKISFIDLENLRKNKKSSGRPQDLADLDNLRVK